MVIDRDHWLALPLPLRGLGNDITNSNLLVLVASACPFLLRYRAEAAKARFALHYTSAESCPCSAHLDRVAMAMDASS
jgi:hypothetical protein